MVGLISYHTIYSILGNKLEEEFRNNLEHIKISLENALDNVNFVSQQLSLDGSVGQSLQKYLTTKDLYEKKVVHDEIVQEINLMTFTNPNLGLVCYYVPDKDSLLFSNYCISDPFEFDKLPVFADYWDERGFVYYGPHKTRKRNDVTTVFSVVRKVQILEDYPVYVFVETELRDLFETRKGRMNTQYLVVNPSGVVTYSESDRFPAGHPYVRADRKSVYAFEETSRQGWKIVSVIPRSDYNREINQWLLYFSLLAAASLAIGLLLAWTIWRTVYRPLRSLNTEIMLISKSHFQAPVTFTGVKEFDFLLMRVQDMRHRIWELLNEVKEQEERKASLEVEKLMHQINPHFIHNTLDTIRWLARMAGQTEIDQLISTLNKVLYYNLGKGNAATIADEIAALRHYVSLQRVRYNFQFDVRIETEQDTQDALIPRFILQPLVENALYHGGMPDDGMIRVGIERDGDARLRIQVIDNGAGMDAMTIQRLLYADAKPKRRGGLGIGIQYVFRMLRHQFGDEAQFQIDSVVGSGTNITLRLPYRRKEWEHDERAGRG